MRAPVSVIIPTLNVASDLPATLGALAEGLAEGMIRELIFADGGSDDGLASIAEEAGAQVVPGHPGRGTQLAAGAAAAQGEWLLFLHADTHVGTGWAEAVLDHIRDHPDKAGYFRLAFRDPGRPARMVAAWANWRAQAFGLPYGDQGLLIRRDLYAAAGGFPPIPLMEDVALARALKGRLVPLAAEARTSAARYQSQGWVRRGGRNLYTLTRYFLGVDPHRLRGSYESD